MKVKLQYAKTYRMKQNRSKRKVCSDTGLPQEKRNNSHRQSNITLKETIERGIRSKLVEKGK